jgi:hypothetical protein
LRSGDDDLVEVVAPLAVIVLWWLSTHGKGTAPGRLVAWGSAVIIVWVLVAIKDPGAADPIPGAFAAGIGQAASGLGAFLGDVFH